MKNWKKLMTLVMAGAFFAAAGTAVAQDGAAEVNACGDGDVALNAAASSSYELVDEQARDQTVDIDEDDVLLGIALANNGAADISWNTLRDVTNTETRTHTESREADFERDDVFSALALGLTSDSGQLEALACVSDVTVTHTETTEMSRTVDLEENEVLLAIALSNSVGSDLVFDDIADISESERTEVSTERNVDIDRDDTFLALALGAGGDGGA